MKSFGPGPGQYISKELTEPSKAPIFGHAKRGTIELPSMKTTPGPAAYSSQGFTVLPSMPKYG